MNIWKILGISETKDKEKLKEAYRERLMKVNPEDDPEGFKELRSAYEEALRLAEQTEEEGKEEDFGDGPVGDWMREMHEIFQSFPERIRLSNWDRLLSEEVCFQIDTRQEIEENLLRYIMVHQPLPHAVIKKLVEFFEIEENLDDLMEKFPKGFLDYLTTNAKYEDSLDFYGFEESNPDLPYDEFISEFGRMLAELRKQNLEEAEKHLENLEEMPLTHPTEKVHKIRILLAKSELAQAEMEAEDLMEEYGDNPLVQVVSAEVRYAKEDYEGALSIYQSILEKNPDHYSARCGMADCDLKLKKYKEAQDIYKDILNKNRFDSYVHQALMECNEELMKEYEKALKKDPKNDKIRIELAWCYYQNFFFDKALGILSVSSDGVYDLDYHYLRGRCDLQIGKKKKAKKELEEWIREFPEFKDGEGEACQKNRDREVLVYYFIAEILIEEEKYVNALSYNDRAIEANTRTDIDEAGMIYTQRGSILEKMNQYEKGIEALTKACEYELNNFEAYTIRGICYAKMNQYENALDDFDTSITINPYYFRPYEEQFQIMLQFDAKDRCEEILSRYENLKIESNRFLLCKAKLLEENKEWNKALLLLDEILDRMDKKPEEDDLSEKDRIYYEKALIFCRKDEKGDLEEALNFLTEALKERPRENRYRYFRANVFWELGYYVDAERDYNTILKLAGANVNVYERLAGVCHDMGNYLKEEHYLKKVLALKDNQPDTYGRLGDCVERTGRLKTSLKYYDEQIKRAPSAYFYVSRGIIYYRIGKYEESERDYDEALKLSEDPYAYYNKGRVYMTLGKYDEAVLLFEKAIQIEKDVPRIFYVYLEKTYLKMGKIDLALEIARKNAEEKAFLDAGSDYAELLIKNQEYEKAEAIFKDLALNESNEWRKNLIMQKLAKLHYSKMKKYDLALLELKKLYQKDPRNEDVKEELAEFYYKTGDYQKADQIYRERAENSWRFYDLSRCAETLFTLASTKQGKSRKKCWEKSMSYFAASEKMAKIELRKQDKQKLKWIHFFIAYSEIMMGKMKEAKKALDRMEKLPLCDHCEDKGCLDYYTALTLFKAKQGDKEGCQEALKEAVRLGEEEDWLLKMIEIIENV